MSKYYEKKTKIDDNGEVFDDKVVPFYSPFKEGKGYNFKYKSTNIKSYLDIPLPKEFSDSEIGRVYRLSHHIYSSSNLLARRSNNEIKPLAKQDIQDLLNIHRNSFNPFWRKVLKHNIIKPIKLNGDEYFCFNPLYFNSTIYIPIYLYLAFQKELIDHLPDWVIKKYLDMQTETYTETKDKAE